MNHMLRKRQIIVSTSFQQGDAQAGENGYTLFPLSTPSRYRVASLNTCPHNARRQVGVAARWASVERGEGWREMEGMLVVS